MKVASVPLDAIGTSLGYLKQGPQHARNSGALEEPLMVIPACLPDGSGPAGVCLPGDQAHSGEEEKPHEYELVDGFKRLAALKAQGAAEVPVVIQDWDLRRAKAMMVELNSRRRTISFYEEALLVGDLHQREGLSLSAIAETLGRPESWVSKRLSLLNRLSPDIVPFVESGELKPTAAYHLSRMPREEQMAFFLALTEERLTAGEVECLVVLMLTLPEEMRLKAAQEPRAALEGLREANAPTQKSTGEDDLGALVRRMESLARDLHEYRLKDPPDGTPNIPSFELPQHRRFHAAAARLSHELSQFRDPTPPAGGERNGHDEPQSQRCAQTGGEADAAGGWLPSPHCPRSGHPSPHGQEAASGNGDRSELSRASGNEDESSRNLSRTFPGKPLRIGQQSAGGDCERNRDCERDGDAEPADDAEPDAVSSCPGSDPAEDEAAIQARPLSQPHPRAGRRPRTHQQGDPPHHPQRGLHRREDHPRRLPPPAPGEEDAPGLHPL
jgi:ParB/RepB/Spo0J family partition protein